MTPIGPKDLLSVFNDRYRFYEAAHQEMNELLAIKEHGRLPARFDDYFPPESHVHVVNTIELAWDQTAARAAKPMMTYVPPRKNTPTARKRAEKVEQIAASYLDAATICGKPSYKTLMQLWASDMVGLGWACGLVMPSFDYETPYIVHRDPRSHYPPIGWAPWKDAKINGDLFAYLDTVGSLALRFPDKAAELQRAYSKSTFGPKFKSVRTDPSMMPIWVGEYFHEDAWYFSVLEGSQDDPPIVFHASEAGDKDHPGVCPTWAFSRHALTRSKGRGLYNDQVSLMAALSRMLSQKIDYFDKTLFARTYISEPVGGEVEEGPGGVTVLKSLGGERPFVQQIAPANPVDADQMIGMVEGFMRMMNRNPDLAGDRDSAKAMQVEVDNTVNSAIQDGIWPAFTEGKPKLISAAVRMDRKLWGNVTKSAQGRRKNTPFNVDYTPNVDLDGYENAVKIEVGIGMAGYHGKLQLLQQYASGTISLATLLEQLPDVMEPAAEERRILSDELKKTGMAILQQMSADGRVNLTALAEIDELVTTKDLTFFEAIKEIGPRLEPPPAPEAPMMPGPGGGAPDMAAMMQNLPPLEGIR